MVYPCAQFVRLERDGDLDRLRCRTDVTLRHAHRAVERDPSDLFLRIGRVGGADRPFNRGRRPVGERIRLCRWSIAEQDRGAERPRRREGQRLRYRKLDGPLDARAVVFVQERNGCDIRARCHLIVTGGLDGHDHVDGLASGEGTGDRRLAVDRHPARVGRYRVINVVVGDVRHAVGYLRRLGIVGTAPQTLHDKLGIRCHEQGRDHTLYHTEARGVVG